MLAKLDFIRPTTAVVSVQNPTTISWHSMQRGQHSNWCTPIHNKMALPIRYNMALRRHLFLQSPITCTGGPWKTITIRRRVLTPKSSTKTRQPIQHMLQQTSCILHGGQPNSQASMHCRRWWLYDNTAADSDPETFQKRICRCQTKPGSHWANHGIQIQL